MKNTLKSLITISFIALFTLLSGNRSFGTGQGTAVGDFAPDFTLQDSNGVTHTLGSYRGKVVVLYLAMWCSTCRANTFEIQREIHVPLKDRGVKVFAVDYLGHTRAEVRAIAADLGLRYPVLMDDQALSNLYGAKMSLTLVIDRDGVIRYRDFYDHDKVKRLVTQLAGVAAPVATTPVLTPPVADPIAPHHRSNATIREKQVFYGSTADEYYGFALPHAPLDLNGDGLPDLVTGSPSSAGGKGAIDIRYGTGGRFPDTPDLTLTGERAGDRFGMSLLGWDLNNDGFTDLAVSAIGNEGTGKVFIFQNSGKGIARSPVRTLTAGTKGDWFGAALAVGDINGDGRADLLVGAPADNNGKGAVYVYYGQADGIPETPDTVIRGEKDYDDFGSNVALADLNGNGYADIIVGAPGVNGDGTDRGAVYFFSGGKESPHGTLSTRDAGLVIRGEADMDSFGGEISVGGDFNGDGRKDLAVGALGSARGGKQRGGAVYIFFGPLAKVTKGAHPLSAADAGLVLSDGTAGSNYATSLTWVGDLNGIGTDVLAVGAMSVSEVLPRAGVVFLYHGIKERKTPEYEVLYGKGVDGRFGRDLSPLGDGRFLVSETGNGEKAKNGGAVHLFHAPRAGKEVTECAVCGMDLGSYRHTRYELTLKDGTRLAACGVRCGLLLKIERKGKVLSATATDFITGRRQDAGKMFYVYGSEAIPDMWPSFIAFSRRDDAERFRKGFGGETLDHGGALQKAGKMRRR